jgi:hypothetical protein
MPGSHLPLPALHAQILMMLYGRVSAQEHNLTKNSRSQTAAYFASKVLVCTYTEG